MANPRPKNQSTELFKKFGQDIWRITSIVAFSVLGLVAIILLVINLENIGSFITGGEGDKQLTPAEQAAQEQAEREEDLLSSWWFLCGVYTAGKRPCIEGGVHLVKRAPLTFKYSSYYGVDERVATFIQNGACPGHWDNNGKTGEFCLEKQSDELYLGWYEDGDGDGGRAPFCLAYGKDSRGQKFDQKPIVCIEYFHEIEQGERRLAEMGP